MEFCNLRKDLEDTLKKKVVYVSEFCEAKRIDRHLLRKLLLRSQVSSDLQWHAQDTLLCTKDLYSEYVDTIRGKLSVTKE